MIRELWKRVCNKRCRLSGELCSARLFAEAAGAIVAGRDGDEAPIERVRPAQCAFGGIRLLPVRRRPYRSHLAGHLGRPST